MQLSTKHKILSTGLMRLDPPLLVPGEISQCHMPFVVRWHCGNKVVWIIAHADQVVFLYLYVGNGWQDRLSLESEQINEIHFVSQGHQHLLLPYLNREHM